MNRCPTSPPPRSAWRPSRPPGRSSPCRTGREDTRLRPPTARVACRVSSQHARCEQATPPASRVLVLNAAGGGGGGGSPLGWLPIDDWKRNEWKGPFARRVRPALEAAGLENLRSRARLEPLHGRSRWTRHGCSLIGSCAIACTPSRRAGTRLARRARAGATRQDHRSAARRGEFGAHVSHASAGLLLAFICGSDVSDNDQSRPRLRTPKRTHRRLWLRSW